MKSDEPRSRRRFGVTARVFLLIAVFAGAFLLMMIFTWQQANAQAHLRYQREVDQGMQLFESELEQATRTLVSLGNYLARQQTLEQAIAQEDLPALIRFFQPWTTHSVADAILVTDSSGAVLFRVRQGQQLPGGDEIAGQGVRDALAGQPSTALEQDAFGHLQERYTVPVFEPGSTAPGGALVVSFNLDGRFIQTRSRRPDQEIALVFDDRLLFLTLTDPAGKPWAVQPVPSSVKESARAGFGEFVAVDTLLGPYLFRFQPLRSGGAQAGTLVGVGVPRAAIEVERGNLFQLFGAGFVVLALFMLTAGYLFARSITLPLGELVSAAGRMASGDLSAPVNLPQRNDELGDLAQAMDAMRKQLRDALDRALVEKGRYSGVVRSMGAAAVITDPYQKILTVNRAAEGLLRRSETELVGQPLFELFQPDEGYDAARSSWQTGPNGRNGDNLMVGGRYRLKQNPLITLELVSTEVRSELGSLGYVHILHDLSAHDQLVRSKDEFIMNAAHELRSPLAALRASLDPLLEDYAVMSKQDLGSMLRRIQRAVVRFQGLVENLVDVGSIQAGRFRVYPAPIPVKRLVDEALGHIQPMLDAKGQAIEVEWNCAEPCMVMADRARIVQVIINLLSNASKYGPEGQPIGLAILPAADQVQIKVTDRGPGIPPMEQTHIFKRFYRGRRAEEEGIGLGLGLALAREIVQAHGGEMDLHSQAGEGTAFWFTLPRVQSQVYESSEDGR